MQKQSKGGSKKHGRNKRSTNTPTSLYAKGKITFEQYCKQQRTANRKVNLP